MRKNVVLFFVSMIAFMAFWVSSVVFGKGVDYIEAYCNPEVDYLVLVNDLHPYNFESPEAIAIENNLVAVVDAVDGDLIYVEKATYFAFTCLQQELALDGFFVGIYDAYRTYGQQEAVYYQYSDLEGWSETNHVFRPGYSDHHTGLTLNVVIWWHDDEGKWQWWTESEERRQTIPYFQKLHESLADFGFIDRYPPNKWDYTGCPSEPYEIRFVGSKEIAHEIMDNNLCLEEWLRYGPEFAKPEEIIMQDVETIERSIEDVMRAEDYEYRNSLEECENYADPVKPEETQDIWEGTILEDAEDIGVKVSGEIPQGGEFSGQASFDYSGENFQPDEP